MTLRDLSQSVLRLAAAVAPGSESETTAGLLYHGNWLPLTPAWLARFPDTRAVERYVMGDASGGGTLAGRWLHSEDASWTHWTVGDRRLAAGPYKVYVSVAPDEQQTAFERCLPVLDRQRTRSFKVSRHVRGLLRPDRFVAYCVSRAEAEELAAALAAALDGCSPHGVPFTATAGTAALSWARDPPAEVAGYAASWRRWVTRKLAAYLHASDAPDVTERAAFACARLRQDGVDTDAWAPLPGLWEQR